MVFMQDNALIHCANKVKEWFKEMGIDMTDWPPYLSVAELRSSRGAGKPYY
jgi:hypothetical protein